MPLLVECVHSGSPVFLSALASLSISSGRIKSMRTKPLIVHSGVTSSSRAGRRARSVRSTQFRLYGGDRCMKGAEARVCL